MAIFDPSVVQDDGGITAAKAGKSLVISDSNHDDVVDGQDLQAMGLQPGSVKAKVAWEILEAKALANIVFPEPGGPCKIMLWEPAAAISKALLACS